MRRSVGQTLAGVMSPSGNESSEPVVITQNGKAAGVLLSPAAYDELTERSRFMKVVEQGQADVEADRVTLHGDVVAEMRRRLGEADDE